MDLSRIGRRKILGAVTGLAVALAGCEGSSQADTDGDRAQSSTPESEATFDIEATIIDERIDLGEPLVVEVVVTNTGDVDGETTVRLTGDGIEFDSETVVVAAGQHTTVELGVEETRRPGTFDLAVDGDPIGAVTVEQAVIHVDPDGDDGADGTEDRPVRTIETALRRAEPGQTVRLAPGEYRELVRTVRDGEPDAPITIEGPPEAVVRPTRAVNDCVVIEHSHVHLRGMTIDGLAQPDRKYETYEAWMPRCVSISPRRRRDEGVEYLRDVVVEPSRMGNAARVMIQCVRVRDSSIGNFEVVGPAGMQFDERVDDHDIGHIREIVYVGSPEVHRGEPYYGYETLDRTRNVRIHHIDNSAGYRHNELVDVKPGSSNITVEYCTTRNAGHNTESGVDPAIALRGNDCTVRWNDLRECPLPISFGAWAPSEDVDGSDWSRDNAVYGNVIESFAAAPFRLRNVGDSGPVSFVDQRVICGNRIERGSPDIGPWVGDVNGFDGSAVDRRGQQDVTVTVGEGTDQRRLEPSAVLVDPGTEVTWEWTGDDEHYVVQRGRVENDPATVPDPRPAPYSESETFPEVGLYRYTCYAHHEQGMGGSVIVVDDESRYAFARDACSDDLPDGDGVGHTGGDGRWS